MNVNRIIFTSLLGMIAFYCSSQIKLSDLDFDKIKQEKIRDYIINQQEHNIYTLSDIKPSLNLNSNTNGYRTRENEYLIKEHFQKVWKLYANTNPGKLWNGKKVSFGLLLSRKDKKIVYNGENISKIDTGQVVYLNLRLIKGLKNLATAFEIINIDRARRIIEFSYLNGNLSEGKQTLTFFETQKGYTRIIHTSYFKSNSIIKNYFLYPYFHTRITNEFHKNMKKMMLLE